MVELLATDPRDRTRRPPVVVTGIGPVSPIGTGVESFWTALLEGTDGVAPIRSFDASRFKVRVGAEVHDFAPTPWFHRTDPERRGRAAQFAVAATRLALADAGLGATNGLDTRTGVAFGTTSGEPREVERFNDGLLSGSDGATAADRFLERYPCHTIPAAVATEFGFAGPNVQLPNACAAGNYALARGLDLLQSRRVDRMVVGGSDAFSRITFSGFARLGAVAAEFCAPFDRNRRGMVPGEGACVLVLERAETARLRGARIYAAVAGYGLTCDAHHMTAAHPEGDGPARAMQAALLDSHLTPADVDYVSAHGTGTPTNDRLETIALQRAFGPRAATLPISSIKSMLGHTMGAASAFEAAACCLAITHQQVPPTIHFEEPDPECAVDCVPNHARELAVRVAMNNAYAFGGANASVVFQEWSE